MINLLNGDEAAMQLYKIMIRVNREVSAIEGTHLELAPDVWFDAMSEARDIIAANKANAMHL